MDSKYDKCINQWDKIFSKEPPKVPQSSSCGNETLDKGIRWLCSGTEKILDFGCGNGTFLFLCALNGTKSHIGIDLSQEAIASAQKRKEQMETGEFSFNQGGVDKLKEIEASSVDGVLLSNIIDNLYPNDAETLLNEVKRILKDNGKVLVKLNPYLTEEKIKEWDIKIIKDNLLDDGLILWNNTTEQWTRFFEKTFNIENYEDVYYPEHEQYNRMFCLVKN